MATLFLLLLYYLLSYAWLFTMRKVHSVIFLMSNYIEQRSCAKFYPRNGISGQETFRMRREDFRDHAFLQRNVYNTNGTNNWKQAMQVLKTKSVPDDCQPLLMNNTSRKSKNCLSIVKQQPEFANYVGIFKGSVSTILKEMNHGCMFTLQKQETIPVQSRSKIKVMLTVFLDYRGILHSELISSSQIINKDLREAIRKKPKKPGFVSQDCTSS